MGVIELKYLSLVREIIPANITKRDIKVRTGGPCFA